MWHEEYMRHASQASTANTENNITNLKKTHGKLPQGAAERKAIPIYTGFVKYFPLAIAEVAKISLQGRHPTRTDSTDPALGQVKVW